MKRSVTACWVHSQRIYLHESLWIITCPLVEVTTIWKTSKSCICRYGRYAAKKCSKHWENYIDLCDTMLTDGQYLPLFQVQPLAHVECAGTLQPMLQDGPWTCLWLIDARDQEQGVDVYLLSGSHVWKAYSTQTQTLHSFERNTYHNISSNAIFIP